jgi:hypothetical protein
MVQEAKVEVVVEVSECRFVVPSQSSLRLSPVATTGKARSLSRTRSRGAASAVSLSPQIVTLSSSIDTDATPGNNGRPRTSSGGEAAATGGIASHTGGGATAKEEWWHKPGGSWDVNVGKYVLASVKSVPDTLLASGKSAVGARDRCLVVCVCRSPSALLLAFLAIPFLPSVSSVLSLPSSNSPPMLMPVSLSWDDCDTRSCTLPCGAAGTRSHVLQRQWRVGER